MLAGKHRFRLGIPSYVLPADIDARTDHVLHVCAGSGIVPNFAILKHALATLPGLRHTLVYGNKTWEEIIFRRQLAELEAAHPGKLRVVHALSREPGAARHGADVRPGRAGFGLLREVVEEPTAVEVFACGPAISKHDRELARERGEDPRPRFLETALSALAELGVPKERIHSESYG